MATTTDEMLVKIMADISDLKAGMAAASSSVASFGNSTRESGAKAQSFMAAISGERAREPLRATALALGQLAGANNVVGNSMGYLLRAFSAMELGLTTMTGGVGLAVAALGGLTALIGGTITARRAALAVQKKQEEEGYNRETRTVEALAARYSQLGDAYRGTALERSVLSAQELSQDAQLGALRLQQEDLERRRQRLLDSGLSKDHQQVQNLERLIALVKADTASIKENGRTVAENAAIRKAASDKNRADMEDFHTRSNALWNDEYMKARALAQAHEEAAQRSLAAWERATGGMAAASAQFFLGHQRTFRNWLIAMQQEAARMLATTVMRQLFRLLGGAVLGVATGGIGAVVASNAVGLAVGTTERDQRTGNHQ